MDRRIESFRRQVLARREGRKRGAAPYDEAARQLACDHAAHASRQGRAWIAIARELGVSPITLRKWCRSKIRSRLVPVTVTAPPALASGARVTLVTPSGLRIEGLDVDGAVALVRALG